MPHKLRKPAAFAMPSPVLLSALLGCGISLGSLGCSGSSAQPGPDRTTDDAGTTGQDDASMRPPGVIVDSDAGTQHALGAAILADKVELCAGECTNLRVTARTPHAPLSYAWTHELGDAAEAQVCPEETTTYQVKVSELVEQQGEFTPEARIEEAQLTVGVRTCEPDNPVLCEFRYRHEFLASGNLFEFDKPWVYQTGSDSVISASGTGVAVTGAFGKRLDLGAGEITGSANMNGFVHKIDADCKSEWTRALGATIPSDILLPLGVASDSQGNVYAASIGGPLLNFDPLVPAWGTFATEIVVHKFSPKGDQLLRVSLPVPLSGLVSDIEVDDSGRIYLLGLTNSWTDFGGGPLGLSPTTMTTFFVALDAAGKHRQSWGNAQAMNMSVAGERVMSRVGGLGEVDFATLLLGVPPVTSSDTRLKQLRQGTLQDAFTLAPFSQFEYPIQFGLFPDNTSALVLQGHVPEESLQDLSVARLSATGVTTSRTRIFRSHNGLPDPELDAGVDQPFESFAMPNLNRMRTRSDGSFAITGHYYTRTRLGESVLDAPPIPEPTPDMPYIFPEAQLFAARISAHDEVLWARKLDWSFGAALTGLTITQSDGATWVSGRGIVPANANGGASAQQDLVIAKLRAEP